MGQKVNPIGLRLGINRTWDSRWFSDKESGREYGRLLHKDLAIRAFLLKKLKDASVSNIFIERPTGKLKITVVCARPGVVIGKKGADIEKLRADLKAFCGQEVAVNLLEVRKPEIDSQVVADGIAQQLEKRVSFRRALKRAMSSAMRAGAEGIRINCSGRLGGAEIARMEWYREGRVPLHTLRSDIDYATAEAMTTYGIIGIKVWICKGEILEHNPFATEKKILAQQIQNR
ncbi:MAG: 30S ribosomal protein S3 [Alphaproteobacteria bacterium]|nr:30S ribosomal protein S3 [Alphaproteobacteria bacterium]